ncbi:MAG: SDR family oxidoreductase [Rhodospirillaceae bacterium]
MAKSALAGKTAVITGSTRNIGRATALDLAGDGVNIVVNGVQDEAAAKSVADEVDAIGKETGAKAILKMGDVSKKADCDALIQAAVDTFGSVDILVVNASTRGKSAFLEMSHEEFRRVVDLTLDSAFFLCQTAIPHMQKTGFGRIVTLGGVSCHVGMPNRIHNLVGKSGLVGFTRGIAKEFATQGIAAFVVSPGYIETDRPASAGPAMDPSIINSIPMGRQGEMKEISATIRFLCQPESAFLTGQTIHANGGVHFGS